MFLASILAPAYLAVLFTNVSFESPVTVELSLTGFAESSGKCAETTALLVVDQRSIIAPLRMRQFVTALTNLASSFATVFLFGSDDG